MGVLEIGTIFLLGGSVAEQRTRAWRGKLNSQGPKDAFGEGVLLAYHKAKVFLTKAVRLA